MSESHQAYLSLGANIRPETNLVQAIESLQKHGRIEKLSNAWESESVGAEGPNYLNACALFVTALSQQELKEQVLLPIELELGRRRTADKFASRTIDIDIVIFDARPSDEKYWEQAFVVIPLAEIYPGYRNPLTGESLTQTAARLRQSVWMQKRSDMLDQFHIHDSSA